MTTNTNAALREKLIDLIAETLSGTYHCTRVWAAWGVGTMSQDDFEDVGESDTPAELADAILAALTTAAVPPEGCPQASAADRAMRAQAAPAVTDDTHAFQNFHRALCERFGYTHDARDWRRDQVSLIEHIAKLAAPAAVAGPDDPMVGAILGAAYDFRDAHLSGSMNQKRSAHAELESTIRTALAAAPTTQPAPVAQGDAAQPRLTVRLTSFPESNGKRNWTAMFVRAEKFAGLLGNVGGITIAHGELWNRVAYAAECARFLIGERDTEPCIFDYSTDIQTPDEWQGETRRAARAQAKEGQSHD